MITKYQSDIENNHVRGIATYTPPNHSLYKHLVSCKGISILDCCGLSKIQNLS